jgi:hypothetical protein
MISTFFFLLLIAFQLWYLTSPQVKIQPVGYQVYVTNNPRNARIVGGILAVFTAVLFVVKFGCMTGLCAWLVGLMGVGGLLVTINPFRYLGVFSVLILYAFFLTLEVVL